MTHYHLEYPSGRIVTHVHPSRKAHEHYGLRGHATTLAAIARKRDRFLEVRGAYLRLLRAGRDVPASWTGDRVVAEAAKIGSEP